MLGRRNGAKKRKWTSGESQVNSLHNIGFIISLSIIYHATDTVHVNAGAIRNHATDTMHVNAGAIRNLMCGLFACTSDNPFS